MAPITSDAERPKTEERRTYSDLPLRTGDPFASAWGLFSDGDELGRLNLLTEDVVRDALLSARSGQTISLNLSLEEPLVPMNPQRRACVHTYTHKGFSNDDDIALNTQASSHWDGLRHVGYGYLSRLPSQEAQYYGGVPQAVLNDTSKHTLGIDRVAQRGGIVARGILLDYAVWADQAGVHYSPFERHAIPLPHLLACAHQQRIQFRCGDVLLIRTGWTSAYRALSAPEKEELGLRRGEERTHVGLEQHESTLRWLFDTGFSAVASDTVALEAWPARPIRLENGTPPRAEVQVCMHEVLLSGWGMLIGESWDLDRLAEACHQRRSYDFLLVSMPLSLPGGVASPSNAVAVL
ncbi:hypothetical protein FA10DRAFT_181511 [Acaromyces ingoldii]|uniref:Cyclase n=1 Tax=Acaromyces ingoldii TaxID=215250 RepID=A0A316YEI8_9BASI|nr:hypothetical protein FA10DRAFT_181511 [Acaromyces ingoldii]PWN87990.1 hypothetical protein FA10DRAFT_181511 [Acaromyces ingoldii]